MTDEEKFKWVEYHKWKFTANWYTPLTKGSEENNRKLVLNANSNNQVRISILIDK